MINVHLRNLENAEKALENFRSNMASDMPPDQVIAKAKKDLESVDTRAFSEYTSLDDPKDRYPELDHERYARVLFSASIIMSSIKRYYEGENTSARTLARISKHLRAPVARRVNTQLKVEELVEKVEEKDKQIGSLVEKVKKKDKQIGSLLEEIEILRGMVRDLEYRLASADRGNSPSYTPRSSPPETGSTNKQDLEKAALLALQANALRHYQNDLFDSKEPGADLEEIRRRKDNRWRIFDFFGK